MSDANKLLGQAAPNFGTLTDLYTVPSGKQAVCSSLVICNRAAVATTFRVSVAAAGAADATSQYLWFDVPLPANNSFIATIGITLGATDKLRVQCAATTVTFTLFGVEIT